MVHLQYFSLLLLLRKFSFSYYIEDLSPLSSAPLLIKEPKRQVPGLRTEPGTYRGGQVCATWLHHNAFSQCTMSIIQIVPTLKVHKIEIFLASILKFVIFPY